MSNLQTKPLTETWVAVPWDEYLQAIADPAKGYYYKGYMRIETMPVSFDHGQAHVVIIFAVNL
ncbi:MAG: hypothetical protein KME35_00770 [Aphanocapsa sp. GSE-SYN-MK-11-07L]|jgi:hypothetical protein|nr:hypothetical protein [Aphanocapsa sp. GSE-SYN-MK-11-07L]